MAPAKTQIRAHMDAMLPIKTTLCLENLLSNCQGEFNTMNRNGSVSPNWCWQTPESNQRVDLAHLSG